jgi:hypothetical protein
MHFLVILKLNNFKKYKRQRNNKVRHHDSFGTVINTWISSSVSYSNAMMRTGSAGAKCGGRKGLGQHHLFLALF